MKEVVLSLYMLRGFIILNPDRTISATVGYPSSFFMRLDSKKGCYQKIICRPITKLLPDIKAISLSLANLIVRPCELTDMDSISLFFPQKHSKNSRSSFHLLISDLVCFKYTVLMLKKSALLDHQPVPNLS